MEHGPPLFLWFQIEEILSVAESPRVCAVVWPPDLRNDSPDFGERRKNDATLVCEAAAFRKTCAGRQSASRPDCAFVQVRQKLCTNEGPKCQEQGHAQADHSHPECHYSMFDGPPNPDAIAFCEEHHHRVAPFLDSATEQHCAQDWRDQNRKGHGAQ